MPNIIDPEVIALLESKLAEARRADHADAPFPMDDIETQIARLKALCAAGAEFLEKPALYRLRVQGVMMTREEVVTAIRAIAPKPAK